jgi:hypothetical protein
MQVNVCVHAGVFVARLYMSVTKLEQFLLFFLIETYILSKHYGY